MENPQPRDKQPWNIVLDDYRKLRFLQYFCDYEITPLDKNIAEVPQDFDFAKTRSELHYYISSYLDIRIFDIREEFKVYRKYTGKKELEIPTPEVLREMLIVHYGLVENTKPMTYKEMAVKYKIGENKMGELFHVLLEKIKGK